MIKRTLILLIPFTLVAVMMLTSFGGGDDSDYPGGSPAGYTGSPGDGHDCMACHGGTTTFVSGWITSNVPADGYIPGETYNITVTVSGTGSKGFEVSPQNIAGDLLGTLAAGSGSELTGNGKYVTQSSASNSNPKVWVFQWTAPTAGTGEVVFYGAFTINKPVTKTSTLTVNENTAIPLSVDATATPSLIYKGDSALLTATPAGGSGNYTYLWSSVPAGFVSTAQSPYAKPVENTTYFVECTDGNHTASASVAVTVQYHVGFEQNKINPLVISPNPVRDVMKLQVTSQTSMRIRLIGLNGVVYHDEWATPEEEVVRWSVDVSSMPKGIYIVSAESQTLSEITKVIICD